MISPRHRIPLLLVGTFGLGIWYHIYSNSVTSQQTHTAIFKSALAHLKSQNQVKELIGNNIALNESEAVKGHVNMFKGQADLDFVINGGKGDARVVFKAKRCLDSGDEWESNLFKVFYHDKVIDLS